MTEQRLVRTTRGMALCACIMRLFYADVGV